MLFFRFLRFFMVHTLHYSVSSEIAHAWISMQACRLEVNSDDSGNLLHEYDNTNMVGCYERCLLVGDCTAWTWWSNTDVCQLFSSCGTDRMTGCIDCQTGPR